MKKIIVCGLALASLSSVALADLQLNFPATKLGGNPVSVITADADLRVDGASVGRMPANQINTGGSPLAVKLIWGYDLYQVPGFDGQTLESLLVDADEDGNPDHQVRLYDVKVYACNGQVYSRGVTSFYTYASGVPFPTNLPTAMPSFQLCPSCNQSSALSTTAIDFGTQGLLGAVTRTFTLCNTSTGDCPPVSGAIVENCDVFTVEPATYSLANGQCQEFTVTFNGVHGGMTTCDVNTGNGVVVLTVNDLVAIDDQPSVFALGEAYPNPFNPSTVLTFSLPETQAATLNVYNTAGQLVRTLVSGTVEAGQHQVVFDAADLASGVYVYTLKTANQTAMSKMVLVK